MRRTINPVAVVFVMILLVLGSYSLCHSAGQRDGKAKKEIETEKALSARTANIAEVETKRIDSGGPGIHQGIQQLESAISAIFGNWVGQEVYRGITVFKLLLCFGLLLLAAAAARVVRSLIEARPRRFAAQGKPLTWVELSLDALSEPVSLLVLIWGIYAALYPLFPHFQRPDGTNILKSGAGPATEIIGALVLIWFIYRLVSVVDNQLVKWAGTTKSQSDQLLVRLVGKTLRIFVVVIAGLILVQNLTGVEVGPLIASLGLGGLAIALAAKDTLANVFGTLTILLDKPFQIGQRVIIDGHDGVVESVGYRSTRLRTPEGHLVAVPNQKVVTGTLENVGRRPYIRWKTNITITYDTPREKVERAVEILREILHNHDGMNESHPPRIFFNAFNDWNLSIGVWAWYHPAGYWDYQAWLQKTCLKIMARFEAEGIEFAFPTQTIYLIKDENSDIEARMLET